MLRLNSRISISYEQDSTSKKLSSEEDYSPQLGFYEATCNSDISTIVNTSILPCSHETTEREFSPFSISPLNSPLESPRIIQKELNPALTTTEATPRIAKEPNNHITRTEKFLGSLPDVLKIKDFKNYLSQVKGDSDEVPSALHSDAFSHENSIA